jgi:hypothetical protein
VGGLNSGILFIILILHSEGSAGSRGVLLVVSGQGAGPEILLLHVIPERTAAILPKRREN